MPTGTLRIRLLAGLAGAVGAETVASALGLVLGVEAEVDEGIVAQGRGHENVAAVAAVAAGGAATGDELLAAEGHAAIAAVAGLDSDSSFIDKHAQSPVYRGDFSVCRMRGEMKYRGLSAAALRGLRSR